MIKKHCLLFLFIICPLFAMESEKKQAIVAFYATKYPEFQKKDLDSFAQDIFNLLPSLKSAVLPKDWLTKQADSVFQFYKNTISIM